MNLHTCLVTFVLLLSYVKIKGEDRAKSFIPLDLPEKSCLMLAAKLSAI